MQEDKKWMNYAIELAQKGEGLVNPNPMVGAVLVKKGEILGQGWHERYGEAHAERNAIADFQNNCLKKGVDARSEMEGATLYVTLEPCSHYGKTPPCTEAIIDSQIGRVVIGTEDPNPLVAGKGIQRLREYGISVKIGVLKQECMQQNEIFFHGMQSKKPYVVMKYAMTADGKIATYLGYSKWITGIESREHVHETRGKLMAIMVGIGTIITDNPMLNCRASNVIKSQVKNPIRIICDSNLRIPLQSNIVITAKEIPTIVACTIIPERNKDTLEDATGNLIGMSQKIEKKELLQKAGITVLEIQSNEKGQVDLQQLMTRLWEERIDSILLEGGAALNFNALESGIVSKVQTYIAPKIFGGQNSKTAVEGCGFATIDESVRLAPLGMKRLGQDFLVEYKVFSHHRITEGKEESECSPA